MSKHHTDLVMCRKQPGIAQSVIHTSDQQNSYEYVTNATLEHTVVVASSVGQKVFLMHTIAL
ncbi:hypothetical protein OIO90_003090 [Microbotryomycetes sp. JL221]|nr:hypothetical protein OIO90_003090 [Microbotryomycetes sp. JL221]